MEQWFSSHSPSEAGWGIACSNLGLKEDSATKRGTEGEQSSGFVTVAWLSGFGWCASSCSPPVAVRAKNAPEEEQPHGDDSSHAYYHLDVTPLVLGDESPNKPRNRLRR
jgi:hypothetical protein